MDQQDGTEPKASAGRKIRWTRTIRNAAGADGLISDYRIEKLQFITIKNRAKQIDCLKEFEAIHLKKIVEMKKVVLNAEGIES